MFPANPTDGLRYTKTLENGSMVVYEYQINQNRWVSISVTQGGDLTEGFGINIIDDVVSVDSDVIATRTYAEEQDALRALDNLILGESIHKDYAGDNLRPFIVSTDITDDPAANEVIVNEQANSYILTVRREDLGKKGLTPSADILQINTRNFTDYSAYKVMDIVSNDNVHYAYVISKYTINGQIDRLDNIANGATINITNSSANALSLDVVPTAEADVDLGNHRITNLATPTTDSDAVTKVYVDTFAIEDKTYTQFFNGTVQSTPANNNQVSVGSLVGDLRFIDFFDSSIDLTMSSFYEITINFNTGYYFLDHVLSPGGTLELNAGYLRFLVGTDVLASAVDGNGITFGDAGEVHPTQYNTFSQNRSGLVPAPTASDVSNNRIVRADGTWVNQPDGMAYKAGNGLLLFDDTFVINQGITATVDYVNSKVANNNLVLRSTTTNAIAETVDTDENVVGTLTDINASTINIPSGAKSGREFYPVAKTLGEIAFTGNQTNFTEILKTSVIGSQNSYAMQWKSDPSDVVIDTDHTFSMRLLATNGNASTTIDTSTFTIQLNLKVFSGNATDFTSGGSTIYAITHTVEPFQVQPNDTYTLDLDFDIKQILDSDSHNKISNGQVISSFVTINYGPDVNWSLISGQSITVTLGHDATERALRFGVHHQKVFSDFVIDTDGNIIHTVDGVAQKFIDGPSRMIESDWFNIEGSQVKRAEKIIVEGNEQVVLVNRDTIDIDDVTDSDEIRIVTYNSSDPDTVVTTVGITKAKYDTDQRNAVTHPDAFDFVSIDGILRNPGNENDFPTTTLVSSAEQLTSGSTTALLVTTAAGEPHNELLFAKNYGGTDTYANEFFLSKNAHSIKVYHGANGTDESAYYVYKSGNGTGTNSDRVVLHVSKLPEGGGTDILASTGTVRITISDNSIVDARAASSGALEGSFSKTDGVYAMDIKDNGIEADKLESTNTPVDGQVASYDSISGGFTWINNSGGGSSGVAPWSSTVTYGINETVVFQNIHYRSRISANLNNTPTPGDLVNWQDLTGVLRIANGDGTIVNAVPNFDGFFTVDVDTDVIVNKTYGVNNFLAFHTFNPTFTWTGLISPANNGEIGYNSVNSITMFATDANGDPISIASITYDYYKVNDVIVQRTGTPVLLFGIIVIPTTVIEGAFTTITAGATVTLQFSNPGYSPYVDITVTDGGAPSIAEGGNGIAIGPDAQVASINNGTAIGHAAAVGGASSVAIGRSAIVNQGSQESTIVGANSAITEGSGSNGDYNSILGPRNIILGQESTILGNFNTVEGDRSGAFGRNIDVAANNSYGIGTNLTVNSDNCIHLGGNSFDNVLIESQFITHDGATPTQPNHVVTKAYVDANSGGVSLFPSLAVINDLYTATRSYNTDGSVSQVAHTDPLGVLQPYLEIRTYNAAGQRLTKVFRENNALGEIRETITRTYDADGRLSTEVRSIT